jgi:hypothetical protein
MQTSIEWLERRFYFTKGQLVDIDFEQAKKMHKQEIIDAHGIQKIYTHQIDPTIMTGEQYYQKKFKKY